MNTLPMPENDAEKALLAQLGDIRPEFAKEIIKVLEEMSGQTNQSAHSVLSGKSGMKETRLMENRLFLTQLEKGNPALNFFEKLKNIDSRKEQRELMDAYNKTQSPEGRYAKYHFYCENGTCITLSHYPENNVVKFH